MPLRPCLGCGRLCQSTRCQPCARAKDRARGTRHERGYGAPHEDRREDLLAKLRPGQPCDRCDQPMDASQALDAAHPHDRPLRTHPDSVADHLEHASCNRGARD